MDHTQYAIVHERINDLLRDAELLRAERRVRDAGGRSDHDVGRRGSAGNRLNGDGRGRAGRRPVRVRLGRWLIGVGSAVAGTNGDTGRGAAGHAA
ncbi:MAG TPA: hypothetical protein VFT20_11375 [Candidatus Limnocylindrales bacterium]|nr:hypothetical protein [Candidatus Limnocylindrales bacterium]